MILAGLPKEVVEATAPILMKYGIKDSKHMGHVLRDIGQAFKEVSILMQKGKMMRAQQLLADKTRRTLQHHGLTDEKQLTNCGKELLEALLDVFKRMVDKE
jgi:uncharacterized protein YacL (UPF0231 family)